MTKYCKRREFEYISNNVPTSVHYVLSSDVIDTHGHEFYNKWSEYINSKSILNVDGTPCYYYYDYKEAVLKANCWFV